MRNTILHMVLFLVLPLLAFGQADTARHRKVYDEVNKGLKSMRRVKAVARAPGVEYDSELAAWLDAGGVRKILAIARDDSGDVEREFYFEGGQLLFVFHAIKRREGKKQVTTVENRFYFEDGKLFKYLGGTEKAPVKPADEDFQSEAKELPQAAAAFRAAVEKPGGKPAQPAKEAKAAKSGVATGTFTGIEQGDYAHLNLKTADGTEDSFFVLNDDNGLKPFVENPAKYTGKKIEVRWEEREENIPEAGGKMEIRVAVGAKLLK